MCELWRNDDKYMMKISEFVNPLPLIFATVRAKTASATSNLKTAIYAEGPSQAQQLLRASYGEDAVVSVSVSEGTQTLTPDQLKLKSLADQKVEVGQRQKEERARQTVAKAQKKMQIVNRARAAM